MTCMTTKQKFEIDNPPVVVLANGRYAYKVECPWEGKNGKKLYAFKFCSAAAHARYEESQKEEIAHEDVPDDAFQARDRDSDSEED